MELIDCHCHLDGYREELDMVISRASDAGVHKMINVGTEHKDWQTHADIANIYDHIYYTVGIHPLNVSNNWEQELSEMDAYFSKKIVPVAIGEIGLDYHYLPNDSSREDIIKLQHTVFLEQLKLVNKTNCPLVVHCRDAFTDCMHLLEQANINWEKLSIHCFSGTAEDIHFLNQRGARGSFTGDITFAKNDKQRSALRQQGIDKLMLETDCPYLSPVPYRGKRNEPAYLKEIVTFAAKLLNMDTKDAAKIIYNNTMQFFELSK